MSVSPDHNTSYSNLNLKASSPLHLSKKFKEINLSEERDYLDDHNKSDNMPS